MANDTFTPEQISQILEEFFKVVGTRQYIGARYVPIFGRKGETSIQWDNSAPYEPLTIVLYQGNSYTSRQYVPEGVAITNESFWALTGNYNAQIEAYRQEVQGFSDRIGTVEDANLVITNQLAGTADSGLKTLINTNTEHLADVDEQLAGTTDSGLRGLIGQNAADILTHTDQLAGTTVSGLKTLIEQRTKTKKHFGVIGDSFSDADGEWPTFLGEMLNLTPVSKAVAATGFIAGTTTFIRQLANLYNDTNWNDLAFIIVYGGTNDFAAAQASVEQMKTAFLNFKDAYSNYTDAPPMIFAFGNLGNPVRTNYNGIGNWYARLTNYLRYIDMPGFIDNVIYWLFPFKVTDVIGSDNLHPTTQGHKVIASYFEQIIRGTYSGVRGSEIVLSSDNTARSIINFVNGIWTIATRLTSAPISAYNTYINIGTAEHSYAFGTIGGTEMNPELSRGLIGMTLNWANQLYEIQYLFFNPINRNVYMRVLGNTDSTTLTGSGVTAGNSL